MLAAGRTRDGARVRTRAPTLDRMWPNFPLRPVAVLPWRRRMQGDSTLPVDSSEAPQRFPQDFFLVSELRFIRNVLIVASAATAKMRTSRGHSIRRSFEHSRHPRANEFLFARSRRQLDLFARQHERHKHDLAAFVRETFASIHKFFDFCAHRSRVLQPENLFQIIKAQSRHT